MADQQRIHYLRARLNGPRATQPVAGEFFIRAQDATCAGAIAHDICDEKSWEFAAYLTLSQAVSRSDFEGEADQLRAFDDAELSGYAVVIGELEPGEERDEV